MYGTLLPPLVYAYLCVFMELTGIIHNLRVTLMTKAHTQHARTLHTTTHM